MPDGEEPVAEPTLESLNADMRAQSSLLRELATAVAQLTARDRVVDGEGAHGSGSGQRFAGQPTGSGGAAERPDLLELAQSGRVGAKSVSAEDDYLAVPELLQRADSGYEAVRPVSRVPGLFPLSTDLTNEYLKQDDRRLPAQEEYLWMSCFGAHMAALFVALDELLPYVPATNQDFTPYLARARNHAEAIDKAFRFRLAFLRRLNEIKRVHGDQGVLDRLQLQVAGVGEDVAADVDAAAKVSTSDGVGRRSSELQEPCEDAFGSDELGQRTLDLLSSSLSAQTLKSYADVHVDTYNITLQIYREKGRAGRRGPDDLRVLLLPVSEHPRVARLLRYFIDNVQSVPLVTVGLAASNFWAVNVAEQSKPWTAATMSDWLSTAVNLVNAAPPAGTSWTSHSLRKGAASAANAIGAPLSHIRYQGGWATNSDVVLDYIDPNVLPSPGAWFFFGHIAPLRHFQVQQDSAAVAFPVPPS
eukprot:jgi/Tetstr1/426076/TSEL_016407.t1